ncbi:MAG TPA: GNAT family N-acetyltransferase [Spirillospora sp.]|nr:GNAT family N-acetyltransferase [Spirillospora sp.]
MQITYHLAAPSDIETMLELIREFYAYDRHEYDEAVVRPALRLLLENEVYGRAWLVKVAGQTAGYIVVTYGFALESGGRDLLIDEIYLREAYRGQGIGTKMIEFLKAFCHEQGIGKLWLEVDDHNDAALTFYQRVGFVPESSLFMQMTIP